MVGRIEHERTFALGDHFSWMLQKKTATDDSYYGGAATKSNQHNDRWLSATPWGRHKIILHQLQGEVVM